MSGGATKLDVNFGKAGPPPSAPTAVDKSGKVIFRRLSDVQREVERKPRKRVSIMPRESLAQTEAPPAPPASPVNRQRTSVLLKSNGRRKTTKKSAATGAGSTCCWCCPCCSSEQYTRPSMASMADSDVKPRSSSSVSFSGVFEMGSRSPSSPNGKRVSTKTEMDNPMRHGGGQRSRPPQDKDIESGTDL
mmetsp:Transcript_13787/g.40324  ORF Transcript_13787/g.40324 Transcript_13787/m.40324 type:complete len:190 (+) Transcript_13787:3839-4408(+)